MENPFLMIAPQRRLFPHTGYTAALRWLVRRLFLSALE